VSFVPQDLGLTIEQAGKLQFDFFRGDHIVGFFGISLLCNFRTGVLKAGANGISGAAGLADGHARLDRSFVHIFLATLPFLGVWICILLVLRKGFANVKLLRSLCTFSSHARRIYIFLIILNFVRY